MERLLWGSLLVLWVFTAAAVGQERYPARQARIDYAKLISQQVRTVSDRLPIPRPADVGWVQAEERAIKGMAADATLSRQMQMYDTPEFQHVALYAHLQEIHKALDCITQTGVELRRETVCWAVVGHLLGDSIRIGDGIRILQRAGRLPKDLGLSPESISVTWVNIFSRNIQETIVIPFLKGDLR